MRLDSRSIFAAFAVLTFSVALADAAPTAAARCASSKLKGSGKAVYSRAKCEGKALSKSEPVSAACVSKADGALASAFSSADAKGGCEPSTGSAGQAQAAVDACIVSFVAELTGEGSCAAGKMKAVSKSAASQLKCWQKGALSGAAADGACLAKAASKLEPAIAKADSAGVCAGDANALALLVADCVQSLIAPGATTTTTVSDTTTTTLPTTTTTSTTTTITITTTTTTTTIDIGPVGWTFCAHAGETCVLPRHDLPVSMGAWQNGFVTAIDGLSVECSPAGLFPGDPLAGAQPPQDCYYLNAGCDHDSPPFGVAVRHDDDFRAAVELPAEPFDPLCVLDGGDCHFAHAMIAEWPANLSVFVVDPRVCDSDDRAHLGYHWAVRYPPAAGNGEAVYAPVAITDYYTRTLAFAQQAMPSLDALSDQAWRAIIEIVQQTHPDFPLSTSDVTTSRRMGFRYADAGGSIAQAVTCQQQYEPGPPCLNDNFVHAPPGTF